MHPRQESGELARRTLCCLMGAHENCRGTVTGGRREGVRCLCECHQPEDDPLSECRVAPTDYSAFGH